VQPLVSLQCALELRLGRGKVVLVREQARADGGVEQRVLVRQQRGEGEVGQLGLVGVQTHAVREGGEDVECLPRDAHALLHLVGGGGVGLRSWVEG